jgi:hypothetical protein
MAVIGRRLIQALLENRINLLEILQKYDAEFTATGFKRRRPESSDRRNCRVRIRLTEEEMRKLITLADRGFYLPGELARILLELFIKGVIGQSDLWE